MCIVLASKRKTKARRRRRSEGGRARTDDRLDGLVVLLWDDCYEDYEDSA